MKKCASCDSELARDEGYYHEDYDGDVCDSCYRDETDTCQLCGNEDLMPSDVSEFILVKCELAVTADKPPGIYRIMRRPFLSIPMIGSGSMDGNDVLFIDRLPKCDSEYDISGHICKKCAGPYGRIFNGVYGGIRTFRTRERSNYAWPPDLTIRHLRHWRGSYNDWLEDCHIKSTVRDHPEMLYDLECEPDDYNWEKFFERYELSDSVVNSDRPWETKQVCRFKTWHDWLALEHRGVKVYFTSEHVGMYGEARWECLALRPEPKFRQLAYNASDSPMLIYTDSLPTIGQVKETYHLRHNGSTLWHKLWYGTWEEWKLGAADLRAAVILAIERGASGLWTNAPGSIHADGIVQELKKAA